MNASASRQAGFSEVIQAFLDQRFEQKTEKLAENDPKRIQLKAELLKPVWLNNAANRAKKIQLATHIIKATHPSAKGSSLYCAPKSIPQKISPEKPVISTAVLGDDFAVDVVCNAADLDVSRFLRQTFENQTLLHWMQKSDEDLAAALSDDWATAQEWMKLFSNVTQPIFDKASHTLSKQIYWLVGENAFDDSDYQLLSPLYSSSLVHAIYQTIQKDKFGEASQVKKKSTKKKNESDSITSIQYSSLAIQQFGGQQPQNISQLNNDRQGKNHLFSSLPPKWKSSKTSYLQTKSDSAFNLWLQEKKNEYFDLFHFLEKSNPNNMQTQKERDDLTDALILAIMDLAEETQQTLPFGWSATSNLPESQQLWLDPFRAEDDLAFREKWLQLDWTNLVCTSFAKSLNQSLIKKAEKSNTIKNESLFHLGDFELRHWRKRFSEHLSWRNNLDDCKKLVRSFTKADNKIDKINQTNQQAIKANSQNLPNSNHLKNQQNQQNQADQTNKTANQYPKERIR